MALVIHLLLALQHQLHFAGLIALALSELLFACLHFIYFGKTYSEIKEEIEANEGYEVRKFDKFNH